MNRLPTDPEALVATLAEEARRDAGEGPMPEPEELLDYLAGRLAPEAEQRVRRRLVASPDAARALLEVAELERAKGEAATAATADHAAPADLAVHAGWRDLKARLRPAPGRRRWLTPVLAAAAAALLVTSVGLGVRVHDLQRERDQPIANLASLELAADTRAGSVPSIELNHGAPLRLVMRPYDACQEYEAVLSSPEPGDRLTIPGLEQDELGLVTPLVRLEPGAYDLELFGCEPRRQLKKHRFQVTWKSPPREAPSGDR